jgi:MarR family transcriptional regulator, organic hydroperoxide resistance regulator
MGGASISDINYAIVRVARAHRQLAAVLLADLGLHPGQEPVLLMLWQGDGRSSTELATGACVEPGTMSRTLASLERAGYVTRTASCVDRRSVVVTLTPAGRDLEPRLVQAWGTLADRTVAGLTPEERRTLADLLSKVSQNLGGTAC